MRNPARMRWRPSPGKARHSQVEATPEEMHRTAFATKARSKFLEYPIALHQNPPESIGVFRIVSMMFFVLIKWDWFFNLVRPQIDGHRQFHVGQRIHHFTIKFRH